MSLDPLNQMTNAGYTFNKDNPFGGTDPSGRLFVPGTGGGCTRRNGGTASATNSCVSTNQLQAFNPRVCVGILAANGIQVNQSSGLCGSPEPSFTQAVGGAAVHYLDDVRHAAAVTGKAIPTYLDQARHFLATAVDRAGCVAKEFVPIPGIGNGGGDLLEGGISAIGIGSLSIGLAALTGIGELYVAPTGGAAILAGGYLVYQGAQLIGSECFP
jgi:hypothetical protein